MTGVTLDLMPWQVEELRAYDRGMPFKPVSRPQAFLRRGFVDKAHGRRGFYRITPLGRAALERVAS